MTASQRSLARRLFVEDVATQQFLIGVLSARGYANKVNVIVPPQEGGGRGGTGAVLDLARRTGNLKEAATQSIGLIADADETEFTSRWDNIRRIAVAAGGTPPAHMPREGLNLLVDSGKKFGAWIMPDNQSSGMTETLAADCIPTDKQLLWREANFAMHLARLHGADWRDVHAPKARLYTYLAWRERPDRSITGSVEAKHLNAHSPALDPLVEWLKKLFDLQAS